jgi:hypothetical protein
MPQPPRPTYRLFLKSSDVISGTALDGVFPVNFSSENLDLGNYYQIIAESFNLVRGTVPSNNEATEFVYVVCPDDLPQRNSSSTATTLCVVNHVSGRSFSRDVDKTTTPGYQLYDSTVMLGNRIRIRLCNADGTTHTGLGSGVAWTMCLLIY